MGRAYHEIEYAAPVAGILRTDAYVAPAPESRWRVIVFPGTPCNKLLYARFLRTAPADIEYIVVSRPGFGRGHDEAVTEFSEQVAAIRPFLPGGSRGGGAKHIVTLGVSYGGELALQAARDHPGAVAGVVTVAALVDEPHDYALSLERFGRDPRVDALTPNRWRKVRAEIEGRRAQIGPLLDSVIDFSRPVECLHGDFDALVPRANSEKLAALLGSAASLEIIPGGTHYLEIQYPRRLHNAVRRVIERSATETERFHDRAAP